MEILSKPKRQTIYKKNDFVVVKDITAKHDFTLCLIKEDVNPTDAEASVVYLVRDKDKSVRNFTGHRDQTIPVSSILFLGKQILATEPVCTRKSRPLNLQKVEIATSEENYLFWKNKVKQLLKESKNKEKEESGDEISEEENNEEPDIPVGCSKIPKEELVKKISRFSLPDPNKKRATAKKVAIEPSSDEIYEESGSDEDGKKKIRKKSVAPKKTTRAESVPKPKKIVILPTFKKNVFNKNVIMIHESVQYDKNNLIPNFDCCLSCNNKEVFRAAKLNSENLLHELVVRSTNLTSVNTPQGPCSLSFPIVEALKNNNVNFIIQLLELEAESSKLFSKKGNKVQFEIVRTGENDKYAYGVATRQVDMARANREGTNAFLYDNQNYNSNILNNPKTVTLICTHLKSEETYMKLCALFPNLESILNYNFYQVVEHGNIDLAKVISKRFVDTQGYGFNKFHHLALAAESIEDLAGMMKVNCRKKASGNRQITPTHLACLNSNPDIIRRFLEVGEELFIVDEFLRKPIHYAAMSSNSEVLQVLLDKGIDCRDYDKNKWTPLMFASMANKPANIALMCQHVVYNVNLKNKDGNAAIHIAVENKSLDSVKELIRLGADLNLPGKNRKTPLVIAAEIDAFDIVYFLVEKGAKMTRTDKYSKTCLHHAVISGNIKTTTYLLSKGAEFKKVDSSGNSPLHYACAYGHYELLEQLLRAGVDINGVNNWNLSPILVALMKNHPRCLNLLVNYPEINVNCQDKDGNSLLDSCLSQFNDMSYGFCEFLINIKHCNVNITDFSGNSVFHRLAMMKLNKNKQFQTYRESKEDYELQKQRYSNFFKLFCDSGINRNLKNLKDFTPFEIAISESNWLFVDLALATDGFEITSLNEDQQSVLHNVHTVFFNKKCDFLIKNILLKFNPALDMKIHYDKNGFNFYHSLLSNFLFQMQYSPLSEWASVKQQFYYEFIRKAKESGNSEEEQLLEEKLNRLELKKRQKETRAVSSFMKFNLFLDELGFNFFDKVQTVIIPFEKYKEEQTKKGTTLLTKRTTRKMGHLKYKTAKGKDDQGDLLKSDVNQIDFVINRFANSTIFHLLMVNPMKQILEQLINFGKKYNKYVPNEVNYFGDTLFFEFAKSNSQIREIPELLTRFGEDPNIPNLKNEYPFFKVCENGNLDILKEFLALKNLNLNVTNSSKVTPFLYFAKQRSAAHCKMLFEMRANQNLSDETKRNALHWAINNNNANDTNFDFEELLISYRVDLNQVDARGRNPIHYFFIKIGSPFVADKKDPIELFADFLSNKDLMIDQADAFGNTPLCYAAQRGANLCFGALIKRGANINHRNNYGNCPLTISLLNNHIDVAVFCIQKSCLLEVSVFEINYTSLLKWQAVQLNYQKALKTENNYNTIPDLRIVPTERVESIIQERNQNQKVIESYEKVDENKPDYEKIKAKSSELLTTSEFRILEEHNFITRELSVFKLAIEKRADSMNYLLLDAGLNLGSAIYDSLEAKLVHYTIKLLKKRTDENNPLFLDQFKFKNNRNQNIAHCFARNVGSIDEKLAIDIIELLLLKNIEIDSYDDRQITPLLYLVANTTNMKIIDHFLSKNVNQKIMDDSNNWFISIFVQNQSILKKRNEDLSPIFDNGPKKMRAKAAEKPAVAYKTAFTSFGGSGSFNFAQNPPPQVGFNMNTTTFSYQPPQPGSINWGATGASMSWANQSSVNLLHSFQEGFGTTNVLGEQLLPTSVIKDPEQIALDFIDENLKKHRKFINQNFMIFCEDEKLRKSNKVYNLLEYALKVLNNLKLARIIIENDGNINQQNEKGYTILTWAIRENNTKIINFLMDFKSKINFDLLDKEGKSYIHHVVNPMKNASYENVDLLGIFANKKNLNQLDNAKKPPIYYAMMQESGKMFEKLRTIGATPYVDGKLQKTVPFLAKIEYYHNEFDFEEDYHQAVIVGMERYKNHKIEIKEIAKPNPLIHGKVTLCQDEDHNPYDVKLIKVDIKYGHYSENVFYVMQICHDTLRNIYILFTNWGRMGTEGQFQQTPFFSLPDCYKEFKKIFKEKTGNEYERRDDFVKIHNKYRLIKTKQRVLNKYIVNMFDPILDKTVPPKINAALENLMNQLTNKKLIQAVYTSFNIDQDLMPFGSLSHECIIKARVLAMDILAMVTNLNKNKKTISPKDAFALANEIAERTSEYYEIIPTVGNRTGQIQAFNDYTIKNEILRLNNIENFEIISRMLAAASYRLSIIHPYDYCLKSLGIKIAKISPDSEEYSLIKKYMKSDKTGSSKIVSVFAIERKGEDDAIKQWTGYKNNRLLWHGTKTENVMGILHQGLRVAPTDAARTGARLGDGIYFGDSFNHSSAFCSDVNSYSSRQSSFILLAEVALGNTQKVYHANGLKPITPDIHSIKGVGKMTPNKHQRIYLTNGTIIPCGKPIQKYEKPPKGDFSYFQFRQNEYVVGNKAQVKLRYLVEFKSSHATSDDHDYSREADDDYPADSSEEYD